jgi:hypothetical protein
MKHFTEHEQGAFLSLPHYTEKHFMLTEGDHAGKLMDLKRSPWLIAPMASLVDWRIQTVTIWKATQSAGTTLAEAYLAYIFSFMPQNALFQAPKRDKARAQADRILRKLERIKLIKDIVAEWQVSVIKGKEIPFFLRLQGATEDNAQSDTAGLLVNDEVWLWDQGILAQFRNRQGALSFKKEINVSSAGESGTDADTEFVRGTQREYHLRCQGCAELVWPLWGKRSQTVYDAQVFQWEDSAPETIKMHCPHCGHVHSDDPRTRERLAIDGDYVQQNFTAPREVESYRWNGFVPYWRKWGEMAEKWEQSLREYKDGRGYGNLRVFVLTTLVEPWQQLAPDQAEPKYAGDYQFEPHTVEWMGDALWHGPQWEREWKRCMTIDVGADHFWVTVSLIGDDFTTRLHYAGKIIGGWDQLDRLQAYFGIPSTLIGVDTGTFVEEVQRVYANIGKRGWLGLEGADQDKGFPWKFDIRLKNGDTKACDELRLYSRMIERPTVDDRVRYVARVIRWSNWMAKGHVYGMRNGKHGYYGVPENHAIIPGKPPRSDHASEYEFQMDAEHVIEEQKDGFPKKRWVRRHRNHYWDCACMTHVIVSILRDQETIKQQSEE